jgi:pantoate--beta-alanine ligase
MSSRNQYLGDDEKITAAAIYRTLQAMRDGYLSGKSLEHIEQEAVAMLEGAGFEVDYVDILSDELGKASRARSSGRVALIAARLGRTRLIDNLEFDLQ